MIGSSHATLLWDLYREIARSAPQAPAVSYAGEVWTYSDLEQRVDRVADALTAIGVGPERLVAVLVERSLELPLALLGVHAAGGAYLPLDPAWPNARLTSLLTDAGVDALIVDGRTAARVADLGLDLPTLQLDGAELPQSAGATAQRSPGDLAYVLYTSGTTGAPKGVEVNQSSLGNLARALVDVYELGPEDRVLQFAAPTFDVAAEELFPTWAAGGCVVLRDEESGSDYRAFEALIDAERITVVNLPATFWHGWVDDLARRGARPPRSLRLVIAGSERVLPAKLAVWRELAGDQVRWSNGYGLSEATVTSTVYNPGSDPLPEGLAAVPIGRPIPGVEVFVVDAEGQPVPDGTDGELWIAGAGIARGYRGDPERTAQSFVTNPFGDQPDTRVLRTGDRVRRLPDGNLAHLGRIDEQLKIRGHRIEPAEVEAALVAHPAVAACAVDARDDGNGATLIAWYVPATDAATDATALTEWLGERLPKGMLPSAFMPLEALPTTSTGKLDRRALPTPAAGRAGPAPDWVEPSTPLARELAELWSKLLGVSPIGETDNFFELGGHSLLAARLLSEVDHLFGKSVGISDLFENPTLADFARRIESGTDGPRRSKPTPVVPVPREPGVPVSMVQEPLWFMTQLDQDLLAYNTQFSIRLHGSLDVDALQRALSEIIRRHEVLRTRFDAPDGRPLMYVEPPFEVELPVVDLTHLPAAERQAEAERLIAEHCRTHFDLRVLPLVDWVLFRLSETEHVLSQAEHHYVHDGWSIALIVKEVGAHYAAFSSGRPSELAPIEVQYADYAIWHRQRMSGPVLDELLEYWTQELAGLPPFIELPTDRPRPAMQTFAGNTQLLELPPDLYRGLAALARREGATPYMALMAAFQVLLTRYTDQEDFAVATTTANRVRPEIEPMIGMVVNTLVLRARTDGDPTFRQLLGRVKSTTLGAYEHQELPFIKLLEALDLPRDFRRNPLFQVMFSFHDSPVPDLEWPELRGALEYRHNGSAKFDINIIVIPFGEQRVGRERRSQDERVVIEWEYNTDLFDHETIERMLGHYRRLLEAALSNPDEKIWDLPWLAEEERQRELLEWNQSATPFPRDMTVHELVLATAARHPEGVALVGEGAHGEESLTYAQLAQRVERRARVLADHGVARGDFVGILLEPGPEIVVSLLAVLATGAAYVPLDPEHPAERTRYVVADAGVKLALTSKALAGHLDTGAVELLFVEDEPQEPPQRPAVHIEPDDLAYAIYTSGSTGKPKGVAIRHNSVVNFLTSIAQRPGMRGSDTLLSVTTFAFDIAVLELLLPLTVGARVVITASEDRKDGTALTTLLERHAVTVMQATPATWQLLLASGWRGREGLRILSGGEALPQELAERLRPLGSELWNLYGPTETTIWSAVADLSEPGTEVVVGGPIANTTLYVLDRRMRPQPQGVPGELCIGGVGVAAGYLGRDELTAERFAPDPYGAPEARLYRTGDQTRRRSNGTLDFLGRRDAQVKLRGFRIELGEIEAVLKEHPSVEDVAVVLEEHHAGDPRLVAYALPSNGSLADHSELAGHLASEIPSYMIPSAFVALKEMPRNASGKLDRRALASAPRSADSAERTTSSPPSTPTERALAGIWERLLDSEGIGRRDNFFDLGGHSLLVMEAIVEVQRQLGVKLTPRHFMLQTLGQLAAVCDEQAASSKPQVSEAPTPRRSLPHQSWS